MAEKAGTMIWEMTQSPAGLALNTARTAESAPTMILLHGVTRRWQSFLPVVSPLAMRHSLELWDQRGHGRSERGSGYLVQDYVTDLVARLEQAERAVILYGHSLGAMVVAAAAATCPEKVRGVILEDPPFESLGKGIFQTRFFSFFQGIAELGGEQQPFESHRRRLASLRLIDPVSGRTQRLGDVRDEVFVRFTARSLSMLDPRVLEPIVAGCWLEGYDWREIMVRIACPIMLLRADPECGGMLTAEDFQWCRRELGDVTCMDFRGTPHLIHVARPMELATQVLGFCESLETSG